MRSPPASSPSLGGAELPAVSCAPPGPESLAWSRRFARVAAPMGPRSAWPLDEQLAERFGGVPGAGAAPRSGSAPRSGPLVYAAGKGSNLADVDGNRYVDLAAGFGALLLGHDPEPVLSALRQQSSELLQALGDVHPSVPKIRLLERLAQRFGDPGTQIILGQSGADALSAALKTALLYTGKSGVIAFGGAYHGLSYGPLALCGLRDSYRAPFAAQLNPGVRFFEYPWDEASLARTLAGVRAELSRGGVGAVVFEPILGRGGCVVPPARFGAELARECRAAGSLLVADEVWTGLGRAGQWLYTEGQGVRADLLCLGKGLGGGLPISACLGRGEVMAAWSRSDEVVHTSTFAGAPLACATALATLEVLEAEALVERAERLGGEWRRELSRVAAGSGVPCEVRGAGLMLGIELPSAPGAALSLSQQLLAAGYVVSLGGGRRESIVLTPALNISERLLSSFVAAFSDALGRVSA